MVNTLMGGVNHRTLVHGVNSHRRECANAPESCKCSCIPRIRSVSENQVFLTIPSLFLSVFDFLKLTPPPFKVRKFSYTQPYYNVKVLCNICCERMLHVYISYTKTPSSDRTVANLI